MNSEEVRTEIDPITLSVVWNKLSTLALQMGERVIHSSQSYIMALAHDMAPALLTPKGELIIVGDFLPLHALCSEIPTGHILEKFGKLDPGDMVLANDAHIVQSGHLNDWTYLVPLYWKDTLVCYMHFRGHVMDTGGALSGGYWPRAYDCIAEGLNIPPVKIIKKGTVNEDAREIILNNLRTAAAEWSDLMLIYGSAMRMQNDIAVMIDKYGLDTINNCVDEMIRRGETAMRDQIRKIPDGEYYSESACDWDGTTPDKQVWVRLKMTVKEDEMTLDFSDSDDQVDFINSPLGNTIALAYMALFYVLDPTTPHNHGAVVPVHIIAPSGKVVNPTRPHTYNACAASVGSEIIEATFIAIGKALPEQAMGCWGRHFSPNVAGRTLTTDPRTGQQQEYFAAPFMEDCGSGAVKGYDGWVGIVGAQSGGAIKRGSVEEQELVTTFRYNIVRIARDSEGPGEFIGARGVYGERECVAKPGERTIIMTGDCDGQTYPIHGVAGAPPAPMGSLYLQRKGKEKEVFKTMEMTDLQYGDVIYTTAPGAGGWGNPLSRDVEKIKTEVSEGYLSMKRAKEVYGVVLNWKDKENPESIEVDYPATEGLRKKMMLKE